MSFAYEKNLAPYLNRLKEIPFIARATVADASRTRTVARSKTIPLSLTTTKGPRLVEAYVLGSNLDYVRAEALATLALESEGRFLLLAAYVTPPMARFLSERGLNFVDLHGNCRVVFDDAFHAEIVGKKRAATTAEKGWRSAGYWTLFALLADPTLLRKSVRTIAAASGSVAP